MTQPARMPAAGQAEMLIAAFERGGYLRAHPAVLQPSEPFLDLSGEDIRRNMFLTSDSSGNELCLRPDLTIPVARDYLGSARAGQALGLCYLGPVFRNRAGKPAEFIQAGVESFGRKDLAAADAEMLALALEATSAFGVTDPEIRAGDVALFAALIEALALPPAWQRRLIKDFNRKVSLAQDLARLSLGEVSQRAEYQGVLAALAGSDRKAAHALVIDLLSIAGTSNVGGRSIDEIADRFLEQASLGGGALPNETRVLIESFLGVKGDPDSALNQLRNLASDARLNLGAAFDAFESRIGFMAARGIDISRITFATSFGRGLDYYTGFEFELILPGSSNGPLVAGGRYDGLLTRLGATAPIPAVGFAIWVEAMTQTGGAA